jgi:hypothetical protein
MVMTMGITGIPGFILCNPSIAAETEIGGVMMPSVSSVPAPINAGK